MGRVRSFLKRGLEGVARRVGTNDLFEQPGERPRTPALSPRAEAGGAEPSSALPAEEPPAVVDDAVAPALSASPPSEGELDLDCVIADLEMLSAHLGPGRGVRVVNHWATWCIPCVEEFEDLKALHAQLPAAVKFSGVSWDLFDPRGDEDDIQEHVTNFSSGHDLTWPSLLIGEAVPAETFFETFGLEVKTVPQTWVLSDSGEVALRIERAVTPADLATIGSVVRALLASGHGRPQGAADG